MMRSLVLLVTSLLLCAPARAEPSTQINGALDAALRTFEAALPALGQTKFGVDVAAYRDALSLQQFKSAHWGGTIRVDVVRRTETSGSCGRFAAFVVIPPERGVVPLVLCPQFFSDGADALRELTILHEIVHVVAGPDECQAMAFAARIEMAAKGRFTPVEAYWKANGCADSAYSLP